MMKLFYCLDAFRGARVHVCAIVRASTKKEAIAKINEKIRSMGQRVDPSDVYEVPVDKNILFMSLSTDDPFIDRLNS